MIFTETACYRGFFLVTSRVKTFFLPFHELAWLFSLLLSIRLLIIPDDLTQPDERFGPLRWTIQPTSLKCRGAMSDVSANSTVSSGNLRTDNLAYTLCSGYM